MNPATKPPHRKNPQVFSQAGQIRKQQQQVATKKSSFAKPPSPQSHLNRSQQQQVRQLPQRHLAPNWLQSLLRVQRVSTIVVGSIFGLSSIVYGYTMHTQTTWRSQQAQLKWWEDQGNKQGVMNETLKQQIAETAEQPASGLVEPKPHLTIFIQSAPPRSPKSLPQPVTSPQLAPVNKISLGY